MSNCEPIRFGCYFVQTSPYRSIELKVIVERLNVRHFQPQLQTAKTAQIRYHGPDHEKLFPDYQYELGDELLEHRNRQDLKIAEFK